MLSPLPLCCIWNMEVCVRRDCEPRLSNEKRAAATARTLRHTDTQTDLCALQHRDKNTCWDLTVHVQLTEMVTGGIAYAF